MTDTEAHDSMVPHITEEMVRTKVEIVDGTYVTIKSIEKLLSVFEMLADQANTNPFGTVTFKFDDGRILKTTAGQTLKAFSVYLREQIRKFLPE